MNQSTYLALKIHLFNIYMNAFLLYIIYKFILFRFNEYILYSMLLYYVVIYSNSIFVILNYKRFKKIKYIGYIYEDVIKLEYLSHKSKYDIRVDKYKNESYRDYINIYSKLIYFITVYING